MPEMLVANPLEAYNTSTQEPWQYYAGRSVYQFVASATIAINTIVTFDTTGNGTITTCGSAGIALGVALNAAVSGGIVDVCVRGFAQVVAGTGGTTHNTLVGTGATGTGVAASATIGANVGTAVTTTTATNLATVYVNCC